MAAPESPDKGNKAAFDLSLSSLVSAPASGQKSGLVGKAIQFYFWMNRTGWFNFASALYSLLVIITNVARIFETSYLNYLLSILLFPFEVIYLFRIIRLWTTVGWCGILTSPAFRYTSYGNHMVQMIFISGPILCLEFRQTSPRLPSFNNNCQYGTDAVFLNVSKIFVHVYFLIFMIANEYSNKNLRAEVAEEVDHNAAFTLVLLFSCAFIFIGCFRGNDYLTPLDFEIRYKDSCFSGILDFFVRMYVSLPVLVLYGLMGPVAIGCFVTDFLTCGVAGACYRFHQRTNHVFDEDEKCRGCRWRLEAVDGCGRCYDFWLVAWFNVVLAAFKLPLLALDELTLNRLNLNARFNTIVSQQRICKAYVSSGVRPLIPGREMFMPKVNNNRN